MVLKYSKYLLLIIILFTWLPSVAQSKKFRYKNVSQKSIELSQDANQLITDAKAIQKSNPTKALSIIEEALAISISKENHYNQAKCYQVIGEINEDIKEWDLAIDNFTKAEALLSNNFSSPEKKPEYSSIINSLGNSYYQLKQYQKGIDNYKILLKNSTTNPQKIDAHLLLYQSYAASNNLIKSKEHLRKAETLSLFSENYKKDFIDSQKNQLTPETKDKDLNIESDSTQTYLWVKDINANGNTSSNYTISQNTNKSAGITAPIEGTADYGLDFNTTKTKKKIELSNTLFEENKEDQAFKELDEAEELVSTTDNYEDQILVFSTQAKLYEKAGKKEEALEAYQKLDSARIKSNLFQEESSETKSQILKQQNSISSLSKDIELDQKDYELAGRDQKIRFVTMKNQRLIIYSLLIIVLLLLIGSFFIYKNARASKIANQLLALKSLRSQMNPHFIFNALNSVNHFISTNDERAANKFLSEFSRLMRFVLENSREDFISLKTEKEIIGLYLKLEHYRFRDKFEYEFNIDETINLETLEIPPMLIQPYIENAVWHGLRYKKSIGHLSVDFINHDNFILISIKDNGIGRRKSSELKTEHQKGKTSIGLKNIEQRLKIINKVYKINCTVEITDIDEDETTGTEVEIKLFKNRV